MAGRGRGRGRGLLQNDSSSPGNLQSRKDQNTSLDDVKKQLENLTLVYEEDNLDNILLETEKSVKGKEDLQEIADFLYRKCINDLEYAKIASCVCNRLQEVEVQGAKFRQIILSLVQRDYKDKETLRKNDNKRYLGFLSMLCQLFANMRLNQGAYIKPLLTPIYDSLESTLAADDCNDDELETLCLQIQCIGKEIAAEDSARMNALMNIVRSKIIQNGSTARGRCTLLELLECYLRHWNKLPNDITLFYCDTTADILANMID